MFLPLAEKMIKKVMNEGRLKAEAEYELYLMILEEQEKWQEALEFLTTSSITGESYFLKLFYGEQMYIITLNVITVIIS